MEETGRRASPYGHGSRRACLWGAVAECRILVLPWGGFQAGVTSPVAWFTWTCLIRGFVCGSSVAVLVEPMRCLAPTLECWRILMARWRGGERDNLDDNAGRFCSYGCQGRSNDPGGTTRAAADRERHDGCAGAWDRCAQGLQLDQGGFFPCADALSGQHGEGPYSCALAGAWSDAIGAVICVALGSSISLSRSPVMEL